MTTVTPADLTDDDIWGAVRTAHSERNLALLGFCVIALRIRPGGGVPHARQVVADAINARKESK